MSGAWTFNSVEGPSVKTLVSTPLKMIVLPYLGAGVGIAELSVVLFIQKYERSCKVNWAALGEIRAAMVSS